LFATKLKESQATFSSYHGQKKTYIDRNANPIPQPLTVTATLINYTGIS